MFDPTKLQELFSSLESDPDEKNKADWIATMVPAISAEKVFKIT